jgi:precorrin-6B C5,15-methyltransferase / cobalt-precorrin-6B C5,C15-methyltransferase
MSGCTKRKCAAFSLEFIDGVASAMNPWLSIVGIGDDGLSGLTPVAQSLIDQAQIIVGGKRHLAMLAATDTRPQIPWESPIDATIDQLLSHRGQPVCVLASGDPMCYGIGATLTHRIPIAEMTIVPSPSAFSLACARLGWPIVDVETVSLCGRDSALLNVLLYPGAKILALSANQETPHLVAEMLTQQGFDQAQITVLEHLGGQLEQQISFRVKDCPDREFAALNTIALHLPEDCQPEWRNSRSPGLPDDLYQHDGQLTKREVRAITLSSLAPLPGQLLWDVGAGSGAIAIEWLRHHPRCRAIAIEHHPDRLQNIAQNAIALGVPNLQIIAGKAPIALHGLPAPDVIFIGGGLTLPDLFETSWATLKSGGRLVANAVTVETEGKLFELQAKYGGDLNRIAIQRAAPVGKFLGWKAMANVTQWVINKYPT